MNRIIIGNLIAVLQMACLAASICAPNRKKVYQLQVAECVLSLLALIVFGAWSGTTTLLIALYRNWRTMEDKFSFREMVVTAILTVGLGLVVNNNGWIGLIPLVATLELTAFNHYAKSTFYTKVGLLINMVMWGIYAFCIGNFVTGFGEIIVMTVGIIALVRSRHVTAVS